ncbi:MAG: hypothetical protein ACOX6N_00510 [Patescibacteria group bacterium]|jgi:hypothetical protein
MNKEIDRSRDNRFRAVLDEITGMAFTGVALVGMAGLYAGRSPEARIGGAVGWEQWLLIY